MSKEGGDAGGESSSPTHSQSRSAQKLEESQELDKKISSETDSLRDQISAKNQEIESKTKDLNKLVDENKELQLKLDLVTNPNTEYYLIVDQGGGSFSAYLFGEAPNDGLKALQLEKYKSVKLGELIDKGVNAAVNEAIGIDIQAPDGSMNDYSFAGEEHYPAITKWFASFYKNLEEKIAQSYGALSRRTIRQTGKIRALLSRGENAARRKIWFDSFNEALGPDWDYDMMSNENEARIEGEAFYYFNTEYLDSLDPRYQIKNYIGVGIGSSSTQGYVRDITSGDIIVGYDSTAGAKPTKKQNEDGMGGNWKSVEDFTETFAAICEPLVKSNSVKKVVVATNAIGFLCVELTKPGKHPEWEGREEFQKAVTSGLPVEKEVYQRLIQSFCESKKQAGGCWAGNFLLGFINAVCAFEETEAVMLEQKLHHGRGLPVETSWVMYLAQTNKSV